MGNIKKVLAMEALPRRSVTPNMLWTDLCENVHLHFRNVRFDFSEVEFAKFRAGMNHLGMAVEFCANEYGYSEGDPNFLVQQKFEEAWSSDSDYYPDRATIELNRDGTYHFHYRDLRLHFDQEEFDVIAAAFRRAEHQVETLEEFPEFKEKTRTTIPLKFIQPYDEGHRPMVFDREHREGIEYCKGLIEAGERIRPILVAPNGQRLDGFKRYMAHLELEKTTIECIVDPHGRMGGQHNQSMIDDKGNSFESKVNWGGMPKHRRKNETVLNECHECGHVARPKTVDGYISNWECESCGSWNDNEMKKAV